jgi:hypothetical protein
MAYVLHANLTGTDLHVNQPHTLASHTAFLLDTLAENTTGHGLQLNTGTSIDNAGNITANGNIQAVGSLIAGTDITLFGNSIQGGWVLCNETWSYASASAPIFTVTVPGNKTGKYSTGMKVQLTQSSTTKFFIIVAVSYSSPNTTITLYGGTDYTLANAAITNPFWSTSKAPFWFPLDPTKWTVQTTDTTDRTQSSPTTNTWYNLGSVQISVPIGAWNVEYFVCISFTPTGAQIAYVKSTLSTATNSESDSDFTSEFGGYTPGTYNANVSVYRRKFLNLTGVTTYYLNTQINASVSSLNNLNSTGSKLIMRAICAYL